ncbi:MAG: LysE family transporter [Alphaproteobacteria bacterium]|nr:LysE family transporter [Alphaproteobacteria bacterium]
MIDLFPLLKIAPLFTLAVMSPGPDFMLISAISLSHGRASGVKAASGIALGITFYAALSLWGLGLLFEQVLWLMIVVKVFGGLYLFYLGAQMWRSTVPSKKASQAIAETPPQPRRNAFLTGILTSLTNPKSLAFFASVFALALTPNTNTATKIGMSLFCAVTAWGWFAFVALALSSPKIRARYQRWKKAIDRAAGSILIFFGAMLVLSGKS